MSAKKGDYVVCHGLPYFGRYGIVVAKRHLKWYTYCVQLIPSGEYVWVPDVRKLSRKERKFISQQAPGQRPA